MTSTFARRLVRLEARFREFRLQVPRTVTWIALCATLLVQAAPGFATPPFPPVPASIEGAQTYIYKKLGEIELPIFVFGATHAARKKKAAAVFFHGSGWKAGSVLQFAGYARQLAAHGVVGALVEYRIKEGYGATPFDAVADAKSAIRWVRQNASQFDIDPRQIVAVGGSAGAHIALAAALFEEKFDDPRDDLGISARPDGLFLFVPVLDTTETGYKEGIPLFGGRENELSPIHHMRSGLPPAIILHGTADPWIPPTLVESFTALMHSYKNSCDRIPFAGRGHVFYNHPDYIKVRPHIVTMEANYSAGDFVVSFYLLERFLYQHGFVKKLPAVVEIPH